MKAIETEEKQLREKNLNLQRKLQMEIDRREALHRHLSESESSLEMDEERYKTNILITNTKDLLIELNFSNEYLRIIS